MARSARIEGDERLENVARTRELFWQNVVREFLTNLSVMWAARGSKPLDGEPDVFDGRIGIVTQTGQRVAISAVYPLFACGIPGEPESRALSTAVECTVFQIETPEGQAFTLPLHEIRAVHSLSTELMDELKAAAGEPEEKPDGDGMPFGFAAFTSLARARQAPPPGPAYIGPDFPPPL